MSTLPRVPYSGQVTLTNNHILPFYKNIETENGATGIPATYVYNHDRPPTQLRDLLLTSRADVIVPKSESESTAAASEISPTYNHRRSPWYNLSDLLLASRATSSSSSSAQVESETSSAGIPPASPQSASSCSDVAAVTSHPVVTSPVGVANLRVRLCNSKLWHQFHACTNEMIITKAGRQDHAVYPFLILGSFHCISFIL